jgi:hypothetical protein
MDRAWRRRAQREVAAMTAKLRMYGMAVAVIVALAGCGSQLPGGTAGGTGPAHPACPEGKPYPPGTRAEVDFADSIWHNATSYQYLPTVRTTAAQVGPVLTRIRCSMTTYPDTLAVPAHWADDTATSLPAATPVHTVKGFSQRCRLAVYTAKQLRTYVATNHTKHGPAPRPCAKVPS